MILNPFLLMLPTLSQVILAISKVDEQNSQTNVFDFARSKNAFTKVLGQEEFFIYIF